MSAKSRYHKPGAHFSRRYLDRIPSGKQRMNRYVPPSENRMDLESMFRPRFRTIGKVWLPDGRFLRVAENRHRLAKGLSNERAVSAPTR